jgi:hypothetical protein
MSDVTILSPAAIVRPAEDLAAMAAEINAQHEAGEAATSRGLEHYRRAGEALVRAKQAVGRGRWLPWLRANVRFSQQTASCYMRLAEQWDDKLLAAGNLRAALRLLAGDAATEDWRRAWQEAGVWFPAATVPELEAWMNGGPVKVRPPAEIADDDDGYKLLVQVLARAAASYLLQTGKRLPAPPRRLVKLDNKNIRRERDWLAYWEIMVEVEAGHFLRWCDAVGIEKDEKKGLRFPEGPDVKKIRDAFVSECGGDEDARAIAAQFSDEHLVSWMRGAAAAFFFMWDGWQGHDLVMA